MLFSTCTEAEFHQTNSVSGLRATVVPSALLWAPSGSAVLNGTRQGLASCTGGTDGLTCDLVGGPEQNPSRDPGSWQAWPDVHFPWVGLRHQRQQDGPPRCQPDGRRCSLSLSYYSLSQPDVSPLLLMQIATITNTPEIMFKDSTKHIFDNAANMAAIILSHLLQLNEQAKFIATAACKRYSRMKCSSRQIELSSFRLNAGVCRCLYRTRILMCLQLHVPACWTDRFDGWRQAEAKLQLMPFCLCLCYSWCCCQWSYHGGERAWPRWAPLLVASGKSSSHHRSSHAVRHGIEKLTRAKYGVAWYSGGSWKMHLFQPTSALGWLGWCTPRLVSTPAALPAQLLFRALEIEFCWPCNILKTTSATDW